MFSLEEFPEEAGSPPSPHPGTPWGGSPPPSQPGTPPTPDGRGRLGAGPGPGAGPGDPPGDPPPALRGRSRSAPPVLWAARRYGRQLRRMSDEFQLQVLPRPRSVGGAPPGRGGGGGWRETLRAWWGARPAPPSAPP